MFWIPLFSGSVVELHCGNESCGVSGEFKKLVDEVYGSAFSFGPVTPIT
jgi:hypothetical protein